MPANFPVTEKAGREISGMGTPDVLGTYGTFSFYTSELFLEDREIGGGEIYPLDLWGDVAEGILYGPDSPEGGKYEQPFKVYRDDRDDVAKLVVGDNVFILRAGEWSDWVAFDFSWGVPVPGMGGSTAVIARFYLRQVQPEVELYVSPLNHDPMDPSIELAHPRSYAVELAEESGRYYTQGMPEDTKALSEGVITVDEFLAQAKIAGDELAEQYRHVLADYEDGLLFYYFGNLDQVCHMMWRATDPTHPAYDEERDGPTATSSCSSTRTPTGSSATRWTTWATTRRSSSCRTTGSRVGSVPSISTRGSSRTAIWRSRTRISRKRPGSTRTSTGRRPAPTGSA